ncbi:MAG: site-specific DNA-methyltransferase [Bacteroidales bacterium]|nr:site-specific DNA-methyltransferase [Bacteroidales bacterium]
MINKLILGDNLEVLKKIERETVDLIYLDPPFFSNRNYEVIWGDEGEVRSFQDRWAGGIDHYIAWLRERVEQMHRILKPTGSIFLHCDWHADAYIRVEILDKIFGKNNFRNEIVWSYKTTLKASSHHLGRDHDTIFVYAKSKDFLIHPDQNDYPPSGNTLKRWGKYADADGFVSNKYFAGSASTIINTDDELKGFNINHGVPRDVWEITHLTGNNPEKIGYPTQKPFALLERIIKMASNEGDVVLDPFVGGGTTIAVADKLGRKWTGIDQSVQAIKVTELRLDRQRDLFSAPFIVQLHKYDYDTLRYQNAFEFESFIITHFGGIPQNKKGGDKGVDGKTADGTPIQVKRSDGIVRDVVDKFPTAAKRYDSALFDKNIATGKPVGYIIAFSFSKGAVEEVARLKLKENIIIKLVTVEEIVPVSKKPDITVEINEQSRDSKGVREIEFVAAGQSEAGIEFYSWDFEYSADKGFRASVIIDREGRQRHKLKAGVHHIAVKVVDNDGLENIEVIRLKVNGTVERTE